MLERLFDRMTPRIKERWPEKEAEVRRIFPMATYYVEDMHRDKIVIGTPGTVRLDMLEDLRHAVGATYVEVLAVAKDEYPNPPDDEDCPRYESDQALLIQAYGVFR